MCKKLMVLVLVLGICSVASASGIWDNDANNNLWSDPCNWGADILPTTANNADIKMDGADRCIIDSTTTAVPAVALQVFMGLGDGAVGELEIQTGGVLNAASNFAIGEATNGQGTLTMTGGSVTMAAGGIFNRWGIADVNITGGTMALGAQIYLSQYAAAVSNMTVGGTANITITGGGILLSPGETPGVSTFNMTGGTCSGASEISVGFAGTGTLNMSAGSLQTAGHMVTGRQSGSVGTITISGGTIDCTTAFQIGQDAGSTGTGTMTGGLVLMGTDGIMEIAKNGSGILHFSGGTIIDKDDDRVNFYQQYISDGLMDGGGGDARNIKIDYVDPDTIITWDPNGQYRASFPSHLGSVCLTTLADTLSWSAGDNATNHDVYLSTSESLVTSRSGTVLVYSGSGLSIVRTLGLGQTYYWAVDETDSGGTPHPGDVWQFNTGDCFCVDDFEDYTGTPLPHSQTPVSGELRYTWSDGYSAFPPDSGSLITLATTGAQSGSQAMIIDYNNTGNVIWVATTSYVADPCWISDAYVTPPEPNFNIGGAKTLSLWFRGDSTNPTKEQLSVTLESNSGAQTETEVYAGDPNHMQNNDWREWQIYYTDLTTVSLTNVTKFLVRVGDNSAAGDAGTIYVDEVRLCGCSCLNPPASDLTGDCKVTFADFQIMAGEWLDCGLGPDPACCP